MAAFATSLQHQACWQTEGVPVYVQRRAKVKTRTWRAFGLSISVFHKPKLIFSVL